MEEEIARWRVNKEREGGGVGVRRGEEGAGECEWEEGEGRRGGTNLKCSRTGAANVPFLSIIYEGTFPPRASQNLKQPEFR